MRPWWRILAHLAIVGFSVVLFGSVYGTALLHPKVVHWLSGGDPAPTFYGLNFFFQEPWTWPLGVIRSYNAPIGTSLVYTDSVPLWGILIKFLKPFNWLGTPFQLTGVWMLLCLTLQGVIALRLLLKEQFTPISAVLGAGLLTAWPAWFFRTIESSQHYSLLAHFLILAAISYCLDWIHRKQVMTWKWWTLLGLALGIHFYLFAMVAFLYLIPTLEQQLESKRPWIDWLKKQATLATILGLIGWAFGYFEIPAGEAQGGGFSLFAMDFIALMNSEGHAASQPFEILNYRGPREGFQYLGIGILAPLAWLLWIYRHELRLASLKRTITAYPVRSSVALMIVFLAISRRFWIFGYRVPMIPTQLLILGFIYWVAKHLFHTWKRAHLIGFSIGMLALYNAVGMLLRASGRLGWVIGYALAVWGLLQLKRRFERRLLPVLAGLVVLQAWDLKPLLAYVSSKHPSPKLEEKGLGVRPEVQGFLKDGIRRMTLIGTEYFGPSEVLSAALNRGISVGPNYLARHDHGRREALIRQKTEELTQGNLAADEAVVVADYEGNQGLIEAIKDKKNLSSISPGGFLLFKHVPH
jgi:hypothetical protein